MGQQPRAPGSGSAPKPPSLNEWVLLALLGEEPVHGFALAKALTPDSDLGRILTIRRPLVYRALDRLATAGLVEPLQTEPGDSGPNRTVYRPTAGGLSALDRWLVTPVAHVRDLRVEFLVKLRLLERRGRSPRRLIAAQRSALDRTIQLLIERPNRPVAADGAAADGRKSDGPGSDVVDLWRAHNALAVTRFLDELQSSGRVG